MISYSLKYFKDFFKENHKKWKIAKSTERKTAQNYAKKAFGSEIIVQNQLRKKAFAFKSVQNAFKKRSKPFEIT